MKRISRPLSLAVCSATVLTAVIASAGSAPLRERFSPMVEALARLNPLRAVQAPVELPARIPLALPGDAKLHQRLAQVGPRAVTYTVNITSDHAPDGVCAGPPPTADCTLREAIIAANGSAGADIINFALPVGAGPPTISLLSALPDITDPVTINGYTQSGSSANSNATGALNTVLAVALDGTSAGSGVAGLTIASGSVTVKGLNIRNFTDAGVVFSGTGALNSAVEGCFIGTNLNGTASQPNGGHGIVIFFGATGNTIGGATAAARNLISGNNFHGISISTSGTDGTTVAGNLIGTNAAGTAALANGGHGIDIDSSAQNTTIGGSLAARNVISGNTGAGVAIGTNCNNTLLTSNFIGVNADGDAGLGNGSEGVRVSDANNIQIGNTATGGGNVIASNIGSDISFGGTSSGNFIQNNFIGINAAGSASLNANPAAASTGISVVGATSATIGGTGGNTRNVIAGHTNGIDTSSSQPLTIQGNYIGLNSSGNATIASSGFGIQAASNNNIIGTAGAGNVIAGKSTGIQINGDGNSVLGNILGTDPGKTATTLGNITGIYIFNGTGNTIGGTAANAGNTIAYNTGKGIAMGGGFGTPTNNSVRGNSIHDNGTGATGLGIDLNNNGVSANDDTTAPFDSDTGANNLQNYPVITSVTTPTANAYRIQGTLKSTPSTTFNIDIYENSATDDSGFGEGATYVATTTLTTDASGNGSFDTSNFGTTLPFPSVTATDPAGNTSEFSAALSSGGAVDNIVDTVSDASLTACTTAAADCSLRGAITNVNNSVGPATITFDIPGGGVQTIAPTSALPTITKVVTIDGYTQSGASVNTLATSSNAVLQIEINGAGAGAAANGFNFSGAGDNCTVRGLVINRFGGSAISADNSTVNETFAGNFIGTNAAGTSALPNGTGITLVGPSSGTTIGGLTPAARNVISGNTTAGIALAGTSNFVQGNLIGTNAGATGALGNGDGVLISGNSNTIGGTTATARNLISGNTGNGVKSNGNANTIAGNYIGTNVTGSGPLANAVDGIQLMSDGDIIGGSAAASRNIISGNGQDGVDMTTDGTAFARNALINGNYIGTSANGISKVANGRHGISMDASAIISIGDNLRNVISGNTQSGIFVTNTGNNIQIRGNYIGVTAGGNAPLGNAVGVFMQTTSGVTIGASGASERNIISGNTNTGVIVRSSSNSPIQNNYIGLGADGTTDVGNGLNGVLLDGSTNSFILGGTTAGVGNVLSGNGGGVRMENIGANVLVQGNIIGLAANGDTPVANDAYGIGIFNSANNRIGGTSATPGGRNIISGNGGSGVAINNTTSTNNIIEGNYIGTDKTGLLDRGNTANGVGIFNASNNTVGTTSGAGGGNLISGNGGDGVEIIATAGNSASANSILGNSIGTSSATVPGALANDGAGISIENGASGNFIGGAFANTIAFNGNAGVLVTSAAGNGNHISRNSIFANAGLGIDLGPAGVTANDANDADTGGNDLQNYPVLTGAAIVSSDTQVSGTLNSVPNTTFTLEFFSDPSPDASGFGEGKTYLGSGTVTTNASGTATFTTGLAGMNVTEPISATVTPQNAPFNTSEFSNAVRTPRAYVVDTVADTNLTACTTAANDCSLRGAINNANALPASPDTISFAIPGAGVKTISPATALPIITDTVTIDGYTQGTPNTSATTSNATLLIDLNGTGAGTGADGLVLQAGGCTVKGLAIHGFDGRGIYVQTGGASTVSGCFLGTGTNGTTADGNGDGIRVDTAGNTIGGTAPAARNIISGNGNGLTLEGAAATGNVVLGNFIGVDRTGAGDLGNTFSGIVLHASNNNIGGTASGAGNVISGNGGSGIFLQLVFVPVDNNIIQGNKIGTNALGTGAVANGNRGIQIDGGLNTTIGGVVAAARNLISGNSSDGIGTTGNSTVIRGNYIGTNNAGTGAIPNGIGVSLSASNCSVGAGTNAGNVISGNNGDGVIIFSGTGNKVQNNLIGIAADASALLGNTGNGVSLELTASNCQIGGVGLGNQIAFNGGNGIQQDNSSSGTGNSFRENGIFDNAGLGIDLGATGVTANDSGDADTGPNNLQNFPVIDSVTFSAGNTVVAGRLISAAGGYTVELFSSNNPDSSGNGEGELFQASQTVTVPSGGARAFTFTLTGTINQYFTATATRSTAPLDTSEFSNVLRGPRVFVVDTTSDVSMTACTTAPNDCSLRGAITSANGDATADTINFAIPAAQAVGGVFTITPGAVAMPQISQPLTIDGYSQAGATPNTATTGPLNGTLVIEINGPAANNSGLVVTANDCVIKGLVINRFSNSSGITLRGNRNRVEGCYLGSNAAGTAGFTSSGSNVSNGSGVSINGGVNNVIGGGAPAARNLISANRIDGVDIFGTGAGGNLVQGNIIGLDKAGGAVLGNGQVGVTVSGFTGNTIGGATAELGNIISGNATGMQLFTGANIVQSNFIGTDAGGTVDLGNVATGIYIQTGIANQIGGAAAAAGQAPGNVISGNDTGIDVRGNGTLIQGNLIGTNAAGTGALGNSSSGISSQSSGAQIGGAGALGNVISANGQYGITLSVNGANTIQGNNIGTDINGNTNLGNGRDGILINSVDNNVVGGVAANLGNAIMFNGESGVRVNEFGGSGIGNSIRRNSISNNVKLGIDLNGDSTPQVNDAGDGDAGANNGQNTPVISSVTQVGANTEVKVDINSNASTTLRLELFRSTGPDATGGIEGASFVATQNVTTDTGGNASFTFTVTGTTSDYFTATATRTIAPLDTSEFSAAVRGAVTYVVDTTSSADLTACTTAAADCSLSGAIINSNAGPGGATIAFNIPGTGVQTITPGFLKLTITKPVTINGFTQPGSKRNTRTISQSVNAAPLIQITGEDFGIQASGTSLMGLIINGANGGGVAIEAGANNCKISGCFIGTSETGGNPSGTQDINGDCVEIASTGNTIGGLTAADRNVIGASNGDAIRIRTGANGNIVQGNFLQVNAAGTLTLDSNGGGVSISSNSNLIGGTTAEARNVMSGGNGSGVIIIAGTNNRILRNTMGINLAGTGGLPDPASSNGQPNNSGVTVLDGTSNQIGDGTAANGNIIAFNRNYGVVVLNTTLGGVPTNPTGISIRGNSIYGNDNGDSLNHLGIDLVPSGSAFNTPTPNDAGDADTGANNLQNYPVITSVSSTQIKGTLNSLPSTNFLLDFYDNAAADPSGFGEGKTLISTVSVTTNAAGNATFTATISGPPAGPVSATATNAATGDTSEFSQAFVNGAATLSIDDVAVTEGNTGTKNATFTVTLSAAAPSNVTVNYATANGTATAPADYTAKTGTLTFTPGQVSKTVPVAIVGDTTVEANETFTVNLTAPVNATIAKASGTGTITNDDSAPIPAISINNVSLTEPDTGAANLAFTARLSAASTSTVTVNYATANGTATAPADYTAKTGTLTFAPGEVAKTINVAIAGDVLDEPNETFSVNLTSPSNATISDAQGIGTIIDNDAPPGLSINDITVLEGNSGTANAVFTVTLSAPSSRAISVAYATANGTASAPGDYTTAGGTLSFAAGETTKTIPVPVVGDTTVEADETFFVNLTSPVNATISDAQAKGTIKNDDTTVPTLSINDVSVTEGNSGTTNATFTVKLSAASTQTVTVNYATANSTAVAPGDYTTRTGTLTFAPGVLTRPISVPVVGDTVTETNEAFFVNLSAPVNATIADNRGIGTIVNDDVAPVAVFVVDTISDGSLTACTAAPNDCSLRGAITRANGKPGRDTISFNIPGNGVKTIAVDGTGNGLLPKITDPVTINGFAQPTSKVNTLATGSNAVLRIEIRGKSTLAGSGLQLEAGAAGSLIQGLSITGFSFGSSTGGFPGVMVNNSSGNRIYGNFIGLTPAGLAQPNFTGVLLANGARNNAVGDSAPAARNVISGNLSSGVDIQGAATSGNLVMNNYVGLTPQGTGKRGNRGVGVSVFNGSQGNVIGGALAGKGNVISANGGEGVAISASNANVVQGNRIGTNAAGAAAVPNALDGIIIFLGAKNNTIGGTTALALNLISGNVQSGVFISGAGTTGNKILGNYIGTKADGTSALGNADGVTINAGARSNYIGSAVAGSRNVISGNKASGIFLTDNDTDSNQVTGNYIGVNKSGTAALANKFHGIAIFDGASKTTVGGTTAAARNVISGNLLNGIAIGASASGVGTGTLSNLVQGNYVGTAANGNVKIPNKQSGIAIAGGAGQNVIGGNAAARNIISGNGNAGVAIFAAGTSGNIVRGNYIGLKQAGGKGLGNAASGVVISLGATGNIIGAGGADARNVISGNAGSGVLIKDAGTATNRVNDNYIGTNAGGNAPIANSLAGISFSGGANNTISGNVISGNTKEGVLLSGNAAGNKIQSNIIGLNAATTGPLSNGADGVAVGNAATGNTIRGNSIAHNGGLGIDLGLDGVTLNDEVATDGDSGANNLQNYPNITTVTQTAAGVPLTLAGNLTGTPGHSFTVEVFANDAADPSGHGEGQTYLGSFITASGSFTRSLAAGGNLFGKFISLTATDNTTGDTSEFSAASAVTRAATVTVAVHPGSVTLAPRATQSFAATVTGTTNTAVTWSVDGGAASGTITPAGIYTAPAVAGTYIVRARSVADTSATGTATVTVSGGTGGEPPLAWGYNEFGSVGDNTTTHRLSPVTVNIVRDARLIASGGSHSLAVAGNVLYAWGDNDSGQLGNGDTSRTARHEPVAITLPSGIRADSLQAIACGWYHSLALTSDGRVLAWGLNRDGQCGVTADGPRYVTTPRIVAGLTGITAISGGTLHSLALDGNGKVWAWGNNFYGQLGNGTVANSNAKPTVVSLPKLAKAIGAGGGHSVALLTDGTARAWGWNFYGQLGDGLSGYLSNGDERRSALPVVVKNVSAGAQVSAGYVHNIVLKSDGSLLSWGNNFYGQLGRTTADANGPLAAAALDSGGAAFANVQTVAAGSAHNVALRSDGTIWSWGYNEFGNLGLGNTANQTAPQRVPGLTSGRAVAAGYAHSMALALQGTGGGGPTGLIGTGEDTQDGTAWSSNATVALTFNVRLRSIAAGGVSVKVNGREMNVQSTSIGGSVLVVLLPKGTLKAGDEVAVKWSNLVAKDGRTLAGSITLTAE